MSDMDRFATEDVRNKKTALVVGLDVAGASESATVVKLAGALPVFASPDPVCRLVGARFTGRAFRIKLRTRRARLARRAFTNRNGLLQ